MCSEKLKRFCDLETRCEKYRQENKGLIQTIHGQNTELKALRKEVEKLRPIGEKLDKIKKLLRGALND